MKIVIEDIEVLTATLEEDGMERYRGNASNRRRTVC